MLFAESKKYSETRKLNPGVYQPVNDKSIRSRMKICFRVIDATAEKKFGRSGRSNVTRTETEPKRRRDPVCRQRLAHIYWRKERFMGQSKQLQRSVKRRGVEARRLSVRLCAHLR